MSDSATPWTVAHQTPLSMEFPRQEYRSGLPFPTPGDLAHPGIEPVSPALAVRFFTTVSPRQPQDFFMKCHFTTVWSDRFIQDYFEAVFCCCCCCCFYFWVVSLSYWALESVSFQGCNITACWPLVSFLSGLENSSMEVSKISLS